MKRTVNRTKKQVEYEIPEAELLQKLGIREPMYGGVYYSSARRVLKIFCHIPESEKR